MLIKLYVPSKHKVIDAVTSNYDHKHKVKQYNKAVAKGASVEYWCLKKNNKTGLDFPNLKYVFADEIIERLPANKNNLPSGHWVSDHFGNMTNLINHLESTIQISNS